MSLIVLNRCEPSSVCSSGAKRSISQHRLQIIAFCNTKEFRQYSPVFRGKVVEHAGFFPAMSARRRAGAPCFMSACISFSTHNFMVTAPSFDEGFARVFSSMKAASGNVDVGQTVPDADHSKTANPSALRSGGKRRHESIKRALRETYNLQLLEYPQVNIMRWSEVSRNYLRAWKNIATHIERSPAGCPTHSRFSNEGTTRATRRCQSNEKTRSLRPGLG